MQQWSIRLLKGKFKRRDLKKDTKGIWKAQGRLQYPLQTSHSKVRGPRSAEGHEGL